MVEAIGFIVAFIAILSFGSYFVPVRKLKNPNLLFYHSTMGAGNFIVVVIAILLFGFSFNLSSYGLLAGLTWTIGNFTSIFAVKMGGLAKRQPVFSSVNILIAYILGVLFFKEIIGFIGLSIVGIILLLIGIFLISSGKERRGGDSLSFLSAVIAGISFAVTGSIFKLSQLQPGDFIFSMATSILLTSIVILIVRRDVIRKHEITSGLLSGGLFSIGNISTFFAIIYLGIAIGLPLTQVALLLGVSWGLFYFKEHKTRAELLKILIGGIMIVLAAVGLAFSL